MDNSVDDESINITAGMKDVEIANVDNVNSQAIDTLVFDLQKYSITTEYDIKTEEHFGDVFMPRTNYSSTTPDLESTVRDVSFDSISPSSDSEVLNSAGKLLKKVEKGLGNNALVTNVLVDFCKIGNTFVQGVDDLIKRINVSFENECEGAVTAVASLKSYMLKMVEGQRDFIDAVLNECAVSSHLKEQYEELKKDLIALNSDFEATEAKRNLCIGEMEDVYLQAKTGIQMCEEAKHQNPGVRSRLNGGLIAVLLNFLRLREDCNRFDKAQNSTKRLLHGQCEELVQKLQQLDQDRLSEMRDCLSKFAIYETARIRNLQYDLNGMIQTLDEFDPCQSSYNEKYINESVKFTTPRHPQPFINLSIPRVFSQYAVSRLSLAPPKERVITKLQTQLTKFVNCAWENSENIESVIEEFAGEMHSSLMRQIFCNLVVTRACEHQWSVEMECLKRMSGLLKIVLSQCDRQKDYWTGYEILKMAKLIHAKVPRIPGHDKGPQMCLLQTLIHSHRFWSSVAFWTECLAIVIGQDLQAIFENCNSETITFSPCTRELKSFYNWMTSFGIDKQRSRLLIVKTCEALKLPQSYWQDLVPRNF
ncbi:AH-BAR domain superfamily [Babesia duncani]|uniref:AH-BAR domain superfamily n=1 Tax=Babesia duncani TaxID=323732 RepID=A0AAD9UNW0_9APIC|nr:AH-BAR domain superfamily [Babesia duncani]